MNNGKTEVLGFRITPDEKKQLENLAKGDNRTLANFVQLIIRNYLKESR